MLFNYFKMADITEQKEWKIMDVGP